MRRWCAAAALLGALALAGAAAAQPIVKEPDRWMQPDEVFVFSCNTYDQYGSTAIASASSTITKRGGPDAKCEPASAIKTDLSPVDTRAFVRIAPTNRHGCDFQLHQVAVMPDGSTIACDVLIHVRTTVLP